jgi:hypothetical protein
MCTLSIVPALDGSALRILMNRDERRLRPVARPPELRRLEGARAIWAEDPLSCGTWIAATDAGLVLAVLNSDAHRRAGHELSRGLLIPRLASSRTLDEIESEWRRIDRAAFAPFRLVALDRDNARVFSSAQGNSVRYATRAPLLFASSGLGDATVEPIRAALFDGLLQRDPDPWSAQSRLHAHAWPDRRHLSVMMTRVDAATVSKTEIVVGHHQTAFAYRPVVEGWPAVETRLLLPLQAQAARAA